MRQWWYIPVMLIAMHAAATGQILERQVISPAGSSGLARAPSGNARIAWTAGEPATLHGSGAAAGLTQGFEQPYYEIGTISTESFAGAAGDRREGRILLSLAAVAGIPVTAIRLKIRFNATLLEPVETVPASIILHDTITDGQRTLDVLTPIPAFAASPMILSSISYTVGLGNDSASALEILEAVPIGGALRLRAEAGRFSLLGICREGGPRLVNPVHRAAIRMKPNPVASTAEVEVDLGDASRTRVLVMDVFGREQATLVDDALAAGHYRIGCDLSGLPSGSYTLLLVTPSERVTQTLIIAR